MNKETFKPSKEFAVKLLDTMRPGLACGVGQPKPGHMCIMACFNNALGRPHGDSGLEDCVGSAVRALDIPLNDSDWSSPQARERGMRREAVAKIGSNQIDQNEFSKRLALKVIQRIVPVALRLAASMKGNVAHASKLIASALACEDSETLDAARNAARAASDAARAASDAASDAARAASDAASNAARAASYAARAASDAARAASDAASNAARAASDAASNAARDKMLTILAECAVEVLIELKSPGCEWLYLCEDAAQHKDGYGRHN